MGCCGKTSRPQPVENNYTQTVPFVPPAPTLQHFVYVGNTGLTAIGLVTGRHYRFSGPGSVVTVDSRDAASMAGVPNVRRTRALE